MVNRSIQYGVYGGFAMEALLWRLCYGGAMEELWRSYGGAMEGFPIISWFMFTFQDEVVPPVLV
jgi:hypothetical protein